MARLDAFHPESDRAPVIGGLLRRGLIRPHVLLPVGLAEELSPPQLRWVLLHELAHVRRGDLWVLLLQRVVQAVYFFNPAVWLANRFIDYLVSPEGQNTLAELRFSRP